MRKLFLILMTLAAVSWELCAQSRAVSGTVVDAANGEPLIGATVMPVGGGQGAATDIDGNFRLNLPANVKTVKVTYVGYTPQTVHVSANMLIKLSADSENLQDLVVVAYGTANKESLTGSVAVVGSKDIEERPVTSVTSALEGSAPGVNVNSSTGYPGSAPQIRIRGFNSFNSAAQGPLYVVDGVVYTGAIADINPADVESMSVLKDAASCALYGSRGANGVILITTKKAKGQGRVDVNLQMNWGAYELALPLYDRLDAKTWMEQSLLGYTEGVATSQGKTYAEALSSTRLGFVDSFCKGNNVFGMKDENGVWVPVAGNELFDENGKILPGIDILPGYNDLNWWDAVTRTGFRQEYNLNAAGATEKFDIFASMGYLKQDGYVIETDYERFTGRLNANFNPVSYFRAGINLSATYTKGSTANVSTSSLNSTINPFQTEFYSPIQPIYQHDENGEIVVNDLGEKQYNLDGLNAGSNIVWNTYANRIRNNGLTINGSLYGTAVLPYNFELTLRGGLYRSMSKDMRYSSNLVGSQKGLGGISEEFDFDYNWNFSQTLNWGHDYGLNHVDVVLSHEVNRIGLGYSYVSLMGQKLDGIYALSNFDIDPDYTAALEAEMGYATETYLGRARYNYDQKYFGEVSLSRDGSSQFAKNRRWGTFWSVGGSWIISKEKFMQDITWIDYLKFRAAYGSVGNNQNCSYYNYLTLYDWTYGGKLIPSQIAAPDLKWEATKTLDLALEGSLFDDRFTFSVGYFDKRNADLIFSLPLSSSAGTLDNSGYNPTILTNIGEMKNTGWELQFGVDIIRNANLKWNFNCDFSFVNNKIVSLPNHKDLPSSGYFQGSSRYENYTYEWAGVDMLNGRSLYKMNPDSPDFYTYHDGGSREYNQNAWDTYVESAKADDAYIEIDGVPYTYKTTYAGRKRMGTKLPTVYGSFGTTLSWKGINLGMLFTYSLGGKIMDSNYIDLLSVSSQNPTALHKDVLNSWFEAPEGLDANSPDRISKSVLPTLDTQYSVDNNSTSSRFLTSASYLSFKNLNVSYDLPSKWVEAMKLRGINIGFQMENVFIATARKGLNAESAMNGAVGSNGAYYQPARTYTFQLSVRF